MLCCRRVVCSFLFLLFLASSAAAQSKRAMTVDDVIDLVQLSAPRISPDGRRVLYTASELGKWKDNKRVEVTGLRNRVLAAAVPFLPRTTILGIVRNLQSPI